MAFATLLVLAGLPAFGQSAQYAPIQVLPAGAAPAAITSGDFDSDGDMDLAVCNFGDDSVDIFQNDGLGGMSLLTTYTVSAGPFGILAGDFDGNGSLDLAVMCNSSSRIDVLLNGGAGIFGPAVPFLSGQDPVDFALQDLDMDGDLDITIVNYTIGTLTVLINDGNGAFAFFYTGLSISGPTSIAFGDIDSDGDADAVVASGSFSAVMVIRNDNSAYTPVGFYATGFIPTDILLVDTDFDQRLDIVTCNVGSNDISVLRNRFGSNVISFNPPQHYPVGESPLRLVATHANNNTGVDIAVTHWNGQHLRVLTNDGSGNFATDVLRYTGANPLNIISVDLDGDWDEELLTTDFLTQRVSILENLLPTRLYPGTNEDLRLSTAVNGPLTTGAGNYIKVIESNDLVDLFMVSPLGTFDNMEALIVVQLYYPGFPPIPPLMGVHVNQFGFGGIVAQSTPMLNPLGDGISFVTVPGLEGLFLMAQALVVNQQANNGLLAASDGYEFRIQ